MSVWLMGFLCYLIRRRNRTCKLVHLTQRDVAPIIVADQTFRSLGGPIFALLGVLYDSCNAHWQLRCLTMLPPERVTGAVVVPAMARKRFRLIPPWGSYTAIKCLCGNYIGHYAAISFNGVDTLETDLGKGFVKFYVVDACVLAFWAFTFILNVRYP